MDFKYYVNFDYIAFFIYPIPVSQKELQICEFKARHYEEVPYGA